MYDIYNSPIGNLYIAADDQHLLHIEYSEDRCAKHQRGSNEIIKDTIKQLQEYFRGERTRFDLPIKLEGTDFQTRVWSALNTVRYGETATYKDIAQLVNSPKAFRAVGNANNRNKISIVIPCHRIIGANNNLVGYGGGIDNKKFLLKLEGIDIS